MKKNKFFKDLERWEFRVCWEDKKEIEIIREFKYKNKCKRPYIIIANAKVDGKSAEVMGIKGPFIINNP